MVLIHLSHRISRRTELTVDLDIKADLLGRSFSILASKEGIPQRKTRSDPVREYNEDGWRRGQTREDSECVRRGRICREVGEQAQGCDEEVGR